MTAARSVDGAAAEYAVEFGEPGARAYAALQAEHLATLTGPPDDMWATFADNAEPIALLVRGEVAGCAAVDDTGELLRFFVRTAADEHTDGLFHALWRARSLGTAVASSVDPGLIAVALPHTAQASVLALMYDHDGSSQTSRIHLRPAIAAEHGRAVTFVTDATGDPPEFVDGYLRTLVERQELLVHAPAGEIVGIGERRIDARFRGHAHLGMIVGRTHRDRGLGTDLMRSLVSICRREQLVPLCSTEPGNHPAQRVIRRSGFRRRHTVFRLSLGTRSE